MFNWDDIPVFDANKEPILFDIDLYLSKLSEIRQSALIYQGFGDDHINKSMLNYQEYLNNCKKIYNAEFNRLGDIFKHDLIMGKCQSMILTQTSGPNILYNKDEELCAYNACTNFCIGLSKKGYEYTIEDKNKIIKDVKKGFYLICYTYLEINLK